MEIIVAGAKALDFRLTDESERAYSIPLAGALPYAFVRKVREMDEGASLIDVLIDEFCPELAEDPDFTLFAAGELFRKWMELSTADGVDAGESSASPTS